MQILCVSVRLRYQVLDESTMPKKPAELTISISDASGAQLHAWNLGYLQREQGQQGKYFEKNIPQSPFFLLPDECILQREFHFASRISESAPSVPIAELRLQQFHLG